MNIITNYLKTIVLLGTLSALLVAVGYLLGGIEVASTFFLISLGMNFVSFWFSDKIALSMTGAKELPEESVPQLYTDVRDLASKMDIPAPRIYLTDQGQPNAFATGRNPGNSAVAVTRGLLDALNREEVKAVIAHELAHIKNRDVLISTIAAVMASAATFLTRSFLWVGNSDDRNRNPFLSILLLILTPIVALIIQLAISRSREYSADLTAAEVMGTGLPLADALSKIDGVAQRYPMDVNPSLSSLYIANPLHLGGISKLFSTHPPVAERISRLVEYSR